MKTKMNVLILAISCLSSVSICMAAPRGACYMKIYPKDVFRVGSEEVLCFDNYTKSQCDREFYQRKGNNTATVQWVEDGEC